MPAQTNSYLAFTHARRHSCFSAHEPPHRYCGAMFSQVELAPSPTRRSAVERAWSQLCGPGPMLSSRQRREIITGARRAWAGAEAPDNTAGALGEATYWLAVDAEGITQDLVASFAKRGMDTLSYLEVVGVVSRLSNIDWYLRALGAPTPPIPLEDGDAVATGNVHPNAQITDSWVPMLTNASAPRTLDALPDEGDALRDLHEPMYINMASIEDWSFSDDLSRSQIEYLAARTSYLNECFY